MKHSNGRHKVSDKTYPLGDKPYIPPRDPKETAKMDHMLKSAGEYIDINYPEYVILSKVTKNNIMQVSVKKKTNTTNRSEKVYFSIDEEGNIKKIEQTEELKILFKPKEDDKPKIKVISMMPSFKR